MHHDERGFFMEVFRENWFRSRVADVTFVQENIARSKRGVLRGMHYQLVQPQGKLIRVTEGEVFDVVVDLRQASTTFGCWMGVTLSAKNKQLLWVPEGFAHGYLVLSEYADLSYQCTNYYHPESEVAIRWDDSDVAIQWPLAINQVPLLSEKDTAAVCFQSAPPFSC